MADFTVHSANGQDMSNLWPSFNGGNIAALLSQPLDPNTYWILLTSGARVRYTGTDFTYFGGVVPIPAGGSYTKIEFTDDVGNALATLENFGSQPAADIVFTPAATVLGTADVLTGNAGADVLNGQGGQNTFRGGGGADVLNGSFGQDTFIITAGDLIAGEVVDGGGGFNTILVEGDGAAPLFVASVGSISNIQEIRFSQTGIVGNAAMGFGLSWADFTGWASNLSLFGRSFGSSSDYLQIDIAGQTLVNLTGISRQNWDASDFVRLVGGAGVESATGTFDAEEFVGGGGADQFIGNSGNDRFVINNASGIAGAVFDGGNGTDTLEVRLTGAVGVASVSLSSIERVELGAGAIIVLNAAQMGQFGVSTNTEVTGAGATVEQFRIFTGAQSTVNLAGLTFTEWGTEDRVRIVGDSDAETLVGSDVADTIVTGGGLDNIDSGGGNDLIQIKAADGSFNRPALAINGGSGTDTLEMLLTGGPFDSHDYEGVTISSIERLKFAAGDYNIARFDGTQVGAGLSASLEVIGAVGNWNVITFDLRAPQLSYFDISGFTFTDWNTGTDGDFLQIYASNINNIIFGSQVDDQIFTGGGQDSVNAMGGNDIVVFSARDFSGGPALATSVQGGLGFDKLYVFHDDPDDDDTTPTIMDLRSASISGFETLRFGGREDFETAFIQIRQSQLGSMVIEDSYGYVGTCQLIIDLDTAGTADFSRIAFTTEPGSDWNTSGEDIVVINGTAASDTIIGTIEDDNIRGGLGNDTLTGGLGVDTLDGGAGMADMASYITSTALIRIALDGSMIAMGDAATDTLVNIERLQGTNFNDRLTGDANNNLLLGEGGADVLRGQNGHDTLTGGLGKDNLGGGLGNDAFDYKSINERGDRIIDFNNVSGDNDRFTFDDAAFGAWGIGAGGLGSIDSTRWQTGTSNIALTTSVRFLYETDTGILRYDQDGAGGAAALVIATLDLMPTLISADIVFV